jgi:aminoglycoside phosphotransferase family enzyme
VAQHSSWLSISPLEDVSTAAKVRFLGRPASYAGAPGDVVAVETHMSWVFLAGERAFKLKKPVSFPFLDFSTLAARETSCREEVRLNRRLAPDTYLGVVPLRSDVKGNLSLDGDGRVVDWLVVMRRLPDDRMLDRLLARGAIDAADLERVTEMLASFYRRADRADISPAAYVGRFVRQQALNREVLTRRDFAIDHGRVAAVLDRLDRHLIRNRAPLEDRVRSGRVFDGHGDLRPEHVCLVEPIVIFDCLEFNRELRLADPFDEIAFLGMECAVAGAAWVGPVLVRQLADGLCEQPPRALLSFYRAFRALLRARLALAHLLDPEPREPAKWEPLAARYLKLADQALSAAPE